MCTRSSSEHSPSSRHECRVLRSPPQRRRRLGSRPRRSARLRRCTGDFWGLHLAPTPSWCHNDTWSDLALFYRLRDVETHRRVVSRLRSGLFSKVFRYDRELLPDLNPGNNPFEFFDQGTGLVIVYDRPRSILAALQDILDETWGRKETKTKPAAPLEPSAKADAPFSPYQFAKKVDKVIDEYVRPMLKRDGGDLEIVDIKDALVYCRLKGACSGCAGATQTLKLMVEQTLKDQVDMRIRVIEV